MNTIIIRKSQPPTLKSLAKGILGPLIIGVLPALSLEASAAQEFVPGRILVQPLSGLAQSEFGKIVGGFGGKSLKHIHQINTHVITVPEGREDEFVKLYSRHRYIAHAEKDRIIEPSVTPNDLYFPYQWHLQKIQAPTAWNTTLGSSAITVAVLDSGVDATHPDFAGKLVAGWNVASNNGDTSPISKHGTWVAGVVAAANNNALGVSSVGWNTRVQPVRVTNDPSGSASMSSLADGIVWAADHGAKVANISYDMGWGCNAFILDGAAQYFRSKGGVVIASAGNDSANEPCAANPYLIIVSATDSNDAMPTWSNYGAFVDIAAPGAGIYTTAPGGGYAAMSGTSFSSPITAGVVALMMAANPTLTPDQYESLLKQSADNIGGGALPNINFGWGRVNAANAVLKATTYVATDATPPTTAIVSPGNGATVAGAQVVSVSAQDNVGVARVALYANNSFVGETKTGPSYQFSWNTTAVKDGDVQLVSFAYDGAGNRGASMINTVKIYNNPPVVDTTPPTVAVTNPLNNAKVSGTVIIKVTASDNMGLKQVQIQIDGKTMASSNASPLSYSLKTGSLKSGYHTITGSATDTANLTSQSSITVRK